MANLKSIIKRRQSYIITVLLLAGFFVLFYGLHKFANGDIMRARMYMAISVIPALLSLIVAYSYVSSYSYAQLSAKIGKEVDALQEQDFVYQLVKINFRYIDAYYRQTQAQANRSFIVSLFAALLSFAIVVTGVCLMFYKQKDAAYLATGAGILSEFVAGVFFYLYNNTVAKMGEYHHKLVLTQNITLALKIIEQMDGEAKVKAQAALIDQLTKDINQHIASNQSK